MLKRVVITNYLGESMEYKIDGVEADNPSGLIITSIDGLGPVKADINMATLTTTDGSLYNSARLEGRNIVIKALFTHATSIEEARLLSYRFFPIKSKVHVEIYTDNRNAETDGYVESNEPDIFSDQSGCQISIVCESATFSAIGESGISSGTFATVQPLFKFPFGNSSLTEKLIEFGDIIETRESIVTYEGDYDTGMELHMEVYGDVSSDITIYKDGDQTLQLHPSKISYLVPNTSPTDAPGRYLMFTYSMALDKYKYAGLTPLYLATANRTSVVYNGEIHIIFSLQTTTPGIYKLKHYKFDGINWTEASQLPSSIIPPAYDVRELTSVVYHNEIHLMVSEQHYKWGEEIGWVAVGTIPESFTKQIAVVHQDMIYLIGYTISNLQLFTGAYIYAYMPDIGWDLVEEFTDELRDFPVQPPPLSCAVAFDYGIHFFMGVTHYIYLRSVTPSESIIYSLIRLNSVPGSFNASYDYAISYDEKLHVFGVGISNKDYHYVWNGVIDQEGIDNDTWEQYPTIMQEPGLEYGPVIQSMGPYVYLIGCFRNSYTEEPNNDRLIYGDELVISTFKGKKGVKLLREGNEYNVLNILEKNPDWFILHRGPNTFVYESSDSTEDDLVKFKLYAPKLYEGV